jgi:hypothetical protein
MTELFFRLSEVLGREKDAPFFAWWVVLFNSWRWIIFVLIHFPSSLLDAKWINIGLGSRESGKGILVLLLLLLDNVYILKPAFVKKEYDPFICFLRLVFHRYTVLTVVFFHSSSLCYPVFENPASIFILCRTWKFSHFGSTNISQLSPAAFCP